MIPKVVKTIGDLGGSDVDFAVTTHWHFDHAEGNLALGPQGTWLVAHENSREMMKEAYVVNMVGLAVLQEAYPESAWPDITYDSEMRFHLNGQTVELMHFGRPIPRVTPPFSFVKPTSCTWAMFSIIRAIPLSMPITEARSMDSLRFAKAF